MMNIKRALFRRLLLAWLALSSALGALVFFLELEAVDEDVMQLAVTESNVFDADELRLMGQGALSTEVLSQNLQELLRQHFAIAEVYDRQHRSLAEATRPGVEALEDALKKIGHDFPISDEPYYKKHRIEGRLYLQTLVPLKTHDGELVGYLEGVYEVDDATWGRILERVVRSVVFAILASLVTTLVIYPIILYLNRGLIKFSRDVVLGNIELMEVLGSAIAKRDSDTNAHNYRVTYYAIRLGEAAGIAREALRNLITGAFLHDVGKIGIGDAILLKPGKLTEDEFEVMKTHVRIGVEILEKSSWLTHARDVVEYHHEKYDGSGYLKGLAGEAIPVNARIFAIVDVFDALTSKRPYKAPLPFDEAMAILEKGRGNHFDPALLDRFAHIARDLYDEVGRTEDHEMERRVSELVVGYFFDKPAG